MAVNFTPVAEAEPETGFVPVEEVVEQKGGFVPVSEGAVTDVPILQRPNAQKLFDPEVQKEWSPFIDQLRETAIQGGQFGEASLTARAADVLPGGASDQVEDGKQRYAQIRDRFSKNFDLTNDEADDYLKHKFDLQKEPVSMDKLGQVHFKDDLLAQPQEEIEKAIAASNLPDDKKPNDVELAARLAEFKVGTLENIKKNHPELVADLKLTGSVNEDFATISKELNQTKLQQAGGGAAAGGLRSARDLAGLDVGSGELAFATTTPEEAQALVDRSLKRQESLNQVSQQFNGDKLKILGTDAAAIGGGLYSAAESVAITAATGGIASSVVPLRLLPTIGKAAKAAMAVQPVSGLYATRQATDTYNEAIKLGKSEDEASDLAKTAFITEWGVTTAFSALGAGGLEDIGTKLTKESIKKSWGTVGKDIIKTNFGEQVEEGLINTIQTVAVDAKLHPELTMDDLIKRAKDTAVATAFATGPVSVGTEVMKNVASKSTEELEVIADNRAKEIVLNDENQSTPQTPNQEAGPATTGTTGNLGADVNEAIQRPPGSPALAQTEEIITPLQGETPTIGSLPQATPTSRDGGEAVTAEAQQLLEEIDSGKAIPVAMSEELETLAAENGIPVDENTEPEFVVSALREKLVVNEAPVSETQADLSLTDETQTPVTNSPELQQVEGDVVRDVTQDTTSLKFASLDKDLERLGMPPVAKEFTGTDQENWAEATSRTDEGPKFVGNPESAKTTADKMVLFQEVARRKQAVVKALKGNDPIDLENAKKQFDEAVTASKKAGTLAGAALRAQRFVMKPDRSLETMRSEFRLKINNGAALDPEQSQLVENLQKQLEETTNRLSDLEADVALSRLAEEEAAQIGYIEKKTKKVISREKRKATLKARIERANKRMAERALDPTRFNSGVDSALVEDVKVLVYSYIELGTTKLAEIKDALVAKYGPKIGPIVDEVYDEAVALHSELNSEVDTTPTPKSVRKMAEDFVESGLKGTAVLDAVAEKMGISRKEAQDLFLNESVAVKTRTALQDEMARIRTLVSLTNQIAALKRGEKKTPAAKVKRDAEVERLTKERNALAKSLKIPVAKKSATVKDPDARLIAASQKRTAKIREDIANRNFVKEVKVPKAKSDALIAAQIEEAKARNDWDMEFIKDKLANQSKVMKGYTFIMQPVRAVRTLVASMDLVPLFRQGMAVTLSRPGVSLNNARKGISTTFSEAKAKKLEQEDIKNHPRYVEGTDAGLSITERGPGASLKQKEEDFQGDLAKKIWVVGSLIGASERNYVTYLNGVRMDLYGNFANSLVGLDGKLTPEQAKVIARYVNIITGRGDLGGFEGAASQLAVLFFSPRFWASRIQMVTNVVPTIYGATVGAKETRAANRLIAGEYARLTVGYGLFLSTLYMVGKAAFGDDEDESPLETMKSGKIKFGEDFELDLDPTSTGFLKVRIKNTRFDTTGGLATNLVFFSRLISGKSTDATGKVTELKRSEDYYRLGAKYVRGKLAPVMGAGVNLKLGQDVVGNVSTTRSELGGLILPMSPADIYEQYDDFGPIGVLGSGAFTLLGAGGSTYGEPGDLAPKQKIAVLLGEKKEAFDRKKKAKGKKITL